MKSPMAAGWMAAAVLLLAGGCTNPEQVDRWGTKEQSYYDPAMPEASLNLAAPIRPQAPPAEIRENAISILLQAVESKNPLLRANAIEALTLAPEHLEPAVRKGLADENRGVRFVAAMSVGRQRLISSAHLLKPLLVDESRSVRAAAIFGTHACGRPVDLNPLAAMLGSADPEVKANAAMALGELGNPTAIPMLRQAVGQNTSQMTPAKAKMVDLQLAEAMVMLGAEQQIEPIRAALFNRAEEAELSVLACQICGRLRDRHAVPDLNNILAYEGRFRRPAELRMAAIAALAQIDPSWAVTDVPMAYASHKQYTLRAQAALTLGTLADPVSLPVLATMLSDPHPVVQVSAAGAILRICSSLP
ncbi:MAG: HEAT repeat domain-containing protein [Phycisphaerales bacterium]|nr:MAG: HEAT repeat domain-containing protein [Phycisphaerales bacterium]